MTDTQHHDQSQSWPPGMLVARPWRTGRTVHRNIYAVIGLEPSDADILVGQMDTGELAEDAVRAHNLDLADKHGPPKPPLIVPEPGWGGGE